MSISHLQIHNCGVILLFDTMICMFREDFFHSAATIQTSIQSIPFNVKLDLAYVSSKWNNISQGLVYFRGIFDGHWCFNILTTSPLRIKIHSSRLQLKIYIVHCIVFKCLNSLILYLNKCICWLCVQPIFNMAINQLNWCVSDIFLDHRLFKTNLA